tara:strand:+ start:51554 stop:52699 length:1146 start_codon:yes stop_codon:yes gene_type:complete
MKTPNIKFNNPLITKKGAIYIKNVIESGNFSGPNTYTQACENFLKSYLNVKEVLLTPSCTSALEMTALLLNIREGDEIIMPSYTFVSTANAFVIRGGKPVFADIDKETANINYKNIERLITNKTRAIILVHYAGISCNFNEIKCIAQKYNLVIIEDAAQAIGSKYYEKNLGSLGDFSCFSFHQTKNIHCGEGGALVINNKNFIERARIIREKGTNRHAFLKKFVSKYCWEDIGSSYLTSELNAAYLKSQLESINLITKTRRKYWNTYFKFFQNNERILELFEIPIIPYFCEYNAHMFYLIFKINNQRDKLINLLKKVNIECSSHYLPLHLSPFSKKNNYCNYKLPNTENISNNIIRLPLWSKEGLPCNYICNRINKLINDL